MYAIFTKVLRETKNHKGPYIVAWTDEGHRHKIPYYGDGIVHETEEHARAAKALCCSKGWPWHFVQGQTKNGYVHVFHYGDRKVSVR